MKIMDRRSNRRSAVRTESPCFSSVPAGTLKFTFGKRDIFFDPDKDYIFFITVIKIHHLQMKLFVAIPGIGYSVYYLNKSSLVILLCLVTVRPSYQDRISAADALPAFSKKTQMK